MEVESAVAHVRYVGGRLDHQDSGHGGAHHGFLLLVALIHDPIGRLDTCPEQGKKVLWQPLLCAQGARDVLGQGLDRDLACLLPMPLSSHAICHYEEDKRFRRGRERGRGHEAARDENRILVWPVPASYARVLVRSDAQIEDCLPCGPSLLCVRQRIFMHMIRDVGMGDILLK